jgi:site-specific DNA-methyltransferase (adenine-specific)
MESVKEAGSEVMSDYELYLGDCLEYMKSMPDKSVDAVITDPPYNGDLDYGIYNDTRTWDDYIEWLKLTIVESERVSNGPVLYFLSKPGMINLIKTKVPWWIGVWIGGGANPAGPNNGIMFSPNYEPCLFYGNRYDKQICISDVWRFPSEHNRNGHPCPKPLPLMKHLIYLLKCDTIFDPFMGSGTTGVACMQLGRRFIGCEIDPNYYAIAEKRIKQAAMQILLPLENI